MSDDSALTEAARELAIARLEHQISPERRA
jgi:hypothetical protein